MDLILFTRWIFDNLLIDFQAVLQLWIDLARLNRNPHFMSCIN